MNAQAVIVKCVDCRAPISSRGRGRVRRRCENCAARHSKARHKLNRKANLEALKDLRARRPA